MTLAKGGRTCVCVQLPASKEGSGVGSRWGVTCAAGRGLSLGEWRVEVTVQTPRTPGSARQDRAGGSCLERPRPCTQEPGQQACSLAVTFRWPVVPLVVGLRLLCEQHLVEAAGRQRARQV